MIKMSWVYIEYKIKNWISKQPDWCIAFALWWLFIIGILTVGFLWIYITIKLGIA